MPRGICIGLILVDATVEYKITHRAAGGCTVHDVREAFERTDDVEMSRRPDREPSEIAGFGTTFDGRRLFAALVAVDETDGTWRLKSAWPV